MSTLPEVLVERVRLSIDPLTLGRLEARRHTGRRRGWLVRRALLAADLAGITLSFMIVERFYAHHARLDHLTQATEYGLLALSLPGWVVMAKLYGLYDHDEERADHSTADDVLGVFHLVTVGTWFIFAVAFLTGVAHPTFPKLFAFWALATISIPVFRGAARAYCRRQVEYLQNTLILGTDEAAQVVARKVLKHREYGLNLVGFVTGDEQVHELDDGLEHLAVLGSVDDAPSLISLLDVERVIISFVDVPYQQLVALVRTLNSIDVQIDVVPRLHDILSPAVDVHSIEGVPLIGLRPPVLSRSSALLKRTLDVVGSVIGLVVLSPVFAIVAVATRLDSDGGIFFQQTRMGRDGQTFRIVKFRTMVQGADDQKPRLSHLNIHALNGDDTRMFKIEHDPRVTRVGRVLRRFAIDELPQLVNVLRGEMSLVGPRPLVLQEHAYVTEWAEKRLSLRPGMTGLWQVLGRTAISFEEMVRLDYIYVTTWSLWNDCRLLLRTLPVVVKGDERGY
ncbi:MAG TPA: sugar transferase [Gaiellaceae bacterium]|jgi:exopolysaccharide biosynthesis polyprenyl glycosylphosphotransferase